MRPGQFDTRLGGKPARDPRPAWNDWPALGTYVARNTPHKFEQLDDTRFSEACATCGRNREDGIHDGGACERCGTRKPVGQSCGCFDNGGQ